MIETATQTGVTATTQPAEMVTKKVLHWRKNERMGGMVPVWEEIQTPKQQIADNLTQATQGEAKGTEDFESALENTMAYADHQASAPHSAEEFGFGDLVDMVNPLQHIPLVGHLYREVTGDDIKPIAQIIGGGVYGGAIGAASGLVNTVIEYETGKDLTGNVMALALNGEKPQYRSNAAIQNDPEKSLNEAVKTLDENPHDLPGSVIGFADLGFGKREVYERTSAADGRTAGTMIRKRIEVAAPDNAPREPITEFKLKPMPLSLRPEMENTILESFHDTLDVSDNLPTRQEERSIVKPM